MARLKGANAAFSDTLDGYHPRANCVRLQVAVRPGNYWPETLASLSTIEQTLNRTSLTIVLDLCHWGPKGMNGTRWASFSFNEFVGNWIAGAQRFKNNSRVILQNANEVGMSAADADKFNQRFVTEMRKAGYQNTLMISPPYANPFNLDTMKYWGDANTWIDVHLYDPFTFSHAGIEAPPGKFNTPNRVYDRAVQTRQERAITEMERYRSRNLFLGEFAVSIHNALPEREKYYERAIRFANRSCVGWTYHCRPSAGDVWNPSGIRALQNELG